MNLKIGFLIFLYYSIISLLFLAGGTVFTEVNGYNNTIEINDTALGSEEVDTGGLFGIGVSFTRFVGLVGFGVGLPGDTPDWFQVIFIVWQSLVTVLSIMFFISSIWDG